MDMDMDMTMDMRTMQVAALAELITAQDPEAAESRLQVIPTRLAAVPSPRSDLMCSPAQVFEPIAMVSAECAIFLRTAWQHLAALT